MEGRSGAPKGETSDANPSQKEGSPAVQPSGIFRRIAQQRSHATIGFRKVNIVSGHLHR